jgi:predicted O-methyltransferase YrrM
MYALIQTMYITVQTKKNGIVPLLMYVVLTLAAFVLVSQSFFRKMLSLDIPTGAQVDFGRKVRVQSLDAIAPDIEKKDSKNDPFLEVVPPLVDKKDEKIPLFLVTPSSRPSLLTRSIFHVLPLRECFDVQWIIAHEAKDSKISKAPLFRDVFPWITELFTYDEKSKYGNHERNEAILHILNISSHGLVYFLDDDNTVTLDLCKVGDKLSSEKMYYADTYQCGDVFTPSEGLKDKLQCVDGKCPDVNLDALVDSATFLTPVSLMKKHGILWKLDRRSSDGLFFTDIANAVRRDEGNDNRFQRLPEVRMKYNEISDKNGCLKWRAPWSSRQLHDSLHLYRNLIAKMTEVRETLDGNEKMDRAEISFHDYAHILHVLRYFIPKPKATYVEIGTWKGGTSIFMSRHPNETDVFGIDVFAFDHQREEAEHYRQLLQGKGTVHWIGKDSESALPDLQTQLNGKEIDILFIAGDHSLEGTVADFELYAPLVSDGGFIAFDDFFDTSSAGDVRVAVMQLIRDGAISLEKFDVMGSIQNIMGAGPLFVDDKFYYDWQSLASNEFIIQKRAL